MIPLSNVEALKRRDEILPTVAEGWQPPDEILLSRNLKPVNWVLISNIPEGIGLIAGSSGVGKTVATVPLACAVAGFALSDSDVTTKIPRKVIFITEDDAQLDRSLYGVRMKLEEDGREIDFDHFQDMIHVFPAQRLGAEENAARVQWAVDNFSIDHPILGKVPPLIVFDTASSNFDLDDENSSAQVGKNISALKGVYLKTGAPIWIIAHLVKSAKGVVIDDLINMSARGSGAWEADCSWTAIVGRESDSSRKTILKIDKERTGGLRGREIHFDVEFREEWLTDELGDSVEQRYPLVKIAQGDKQGREQKALDRVLQDVTNAMAKWLEISDRKYMFASEVKGLMQKRNGDKTELFTKLLLQKRIRKFDTPHESHRDHKISYVLPTVEEKFNASLDIVRNCGEL